MKTKINFIIVVLAFMSIQTFAQNRIIGGSATAISDRPFQAFVYNTNIMGKYGGGVILDNYWILTAAHVVTNADTHQPYPASEIKVITGNTDVFDFHMNIGSTVEAVYVHSNYIISGNNDYDIALLKLSSPISFNYQQQAIGIYSSYYIPSNTLATVSGWGLTEIGGDGYFTPMLQSANVYAYSASSPNYTIYSNTTNGITIWDGDSGSPLTINRNNQDYLIGIVRGTFPANPNSLPNETRYINAGFFKNWIYSTMYTNAISGPRVICGDDEFIVNTYGANLELSSNLRVTSQNGNRYQIAGIYDGAGTISLRKDGNIVCSLPVYCGKPIVTDITVVDHYYYAVLAPGNVHRTSAYWEIDQYRITNNDVYCPIQPLGQYSPDYVYVRVQIGNDCGMGDMFSKRISTSQLPSSYTMTYNAASRLIEITNECGDADISENKAGRLSYQIVNTRTGLVCKQGSVPYSGGMIDINSLPAGLYTARLTSPSGKTEAMKIAL